MSYPSSPRNALLLFLFTTMSSSTDVVQYEIQRAHRRNVRCHTCFSFHSRPTLLMKKRIRIMSRCSTSSATSFLIAVQSYNTYLSLQPRSIKHNGESRFKECLEECMMEIVMYFSLPRFHSLCSSTVSRTAERRGQRPSGVPRPLGITRTYVLSDG